MIPVGLCVNIGVGRCLVSNLITKDGLSMGMSRLEHGFAQGQDPWVPPAMRQPEL